jgi:hypothetical protein
LRQGKNDNNRKYPWLWCFIRHLMVGADYRKTTQHGKLWMFHWQNKRKECLEIVVSSTNLTLSALKDQVQAGFHVCLPLASRASQQRYKSWGVLPDFITALALSCGDQKVAAPFVALLKRAECPPRLTFLASVPGVHSKKELRKTPWGAFGLRYAIARRRSRIRAKVLVPYVGAWDEESFKSFCNLFGGREDYFELTWIDARHPWADGSWVLPKDTRDNLIKSGAKFLMIPKDCNGLFHPEHRSTDSRWSHAKLYFFERGQSGGLLISSANFSSSAWGRWSRGGKLAIQNFEIGVYVESVSWPFPDLVECEDPDKLAVSNFDIERKGTDIWALATWNGKIVEVRCRSPKRKELAAEVFGIHRKMKRNIRRWRRLRTLMVGRVPWKDQREVPLSVSLCTDDECLTVSVFDDRTEDSVTDGMIPEVDANVAERLRDEMLFEEYGGEVAGDSVPDDGNPGRKFRGETAGDDYTVEEFEFARQQFSIVQEWVKACREAHDPVESNSIKKDGKDLEAAFQRLAKRLEKETLSLSASGAFLAAEELGMRLRKLGVLG